MSTVARRDRLNERARQRRSRFPTDPLERALVIHQRRTRRRPLTTARERRRELRQLWRGYRLPSGLLAAVDSNRELFDPWAWVFMERGVSRSWHLILRHQYPTRTLIPIARDRETNHVFCLDVAAAGPDGVPVVAINAFTTLGSEQVISWPNFDAFMKVNEWYHVRWLRR